MKYTNLEHFLADAVPKILNVLTGEDIEKLKEIEDLLEINHTFGRTIGNYFGLWNVNKHLGDADIVAHKFIKQLKLQATQ